MASDKRSFTDFENFPGSINAETNIYEFPTLYKVADSGKTRQWTVYIRLIKEGSKKSAITKKQNWSLLEETEVPLKEEYIKANAKLHEGIISELWTESGLLGEHISRSAASYPKAKNVGKKNERNVFQQALSDARSKYLKKCDEGSVKQGELGAIQNTRVLKEKKYFPMLARKYDEEIEKKTNNIKYPLYLQPKLNGERCVAYIDKPDSKDPRDVILYTRQKKEYPNNECNDNIRKSLIGLLNRYYNAEKQESVYLDGELYLHGKALQDIGSETRNTESSCHDAVQYWVYDMFYPSYENEPFRGRTVLLASMYEGLSDAEKKIIKLTPTHLITDEKSNDHWFKYYLKEKYEGAMIRSTDGPYAKSAVKKSTALRSRDLLKRKKVYDDEFTVVNFTEGKRGKAKNAIIWICKTTAGKEFNVTPLGSDEERYKIYKECIAQNGKGFINKYKDRLLKVEYRDLSKDNVPQHAKGINFRDYE